MPGIVWWLLGLLVRSCTLVRVGGSRKQLGLRIPTHLAPPEIAVQLFVEVTIRVLAAAYYTSMGLAHWRSPMTLPGLEPDTCSKDSDQLIWWWWLRAGVHAVDALREYVMVVWTTMAPGNLLMHELVVRRWSLSTKVLALLAPTRPGDFWQNRHLLVAAVYGIRIIQQKLPLPEFSAHVGVLILSGFIGHAWSTLGASLHAHAEVPTDWAGEALVYLGVFCALVGVQLGYDKLQPSNGLTVTDEILRSHLSDMSTGQMEAEAADLLNPLRQKASYESDMARRTSQSTTSWIQPHTSSSTDPASMYSMASSGSRATTGLPPSVFARAAPHRNISTTMLRAPPKASISGLSAAGMSTCTSVQSPGTLFSAAYIAPRMVVRLTGIAIYILYACMSIEHVLAQHAKHGLHVALRVALQLWPSLLLAPLTALAQLAKITLLLRFPRAYIKHRTWLSNVCSIAPLLCRLLILWLEPLRNATLTGHAAPNSNFSTATFSFISLSLLLREDSWIRHVINTTCSGVLLLSAKAMRAGRLPPFPLFRPADMSAWWARLLYLAWTHPTYPGTLLLAAIVQPVFKHTFTNPATLRSKHSGSCSGASTICNSVLVLGAGNPTSNPAGAAAISPAAAQADKPAPAARTARHLLWQWLQGSVESAASAAASTAIASGSRLKQVSPQWLISAVERVTSADVIGSALLLWLRSHMFYVCVEDVVQRTKGAAWGNDIAVGLGQLGRPSVAAHAVSIAYSAFLLSCTLWRLPLYGKHHTFMWALQLLCCALLQHWALHVTYMRVASSEAHDELGAPINVAYFSSPILSLFVTSISWPLLGLHIGSYKLLVAVRLSLTLSMFCAFLPNQTCIREPMLLGLMGIQVLICMLTLYVTSNEARHRLPKLINRKAAQNKAAGSGLSAGCRLLLTLLRTPERTASTVLATVGLVLLTCISHQKAAGLLALDMPVMQAANEGFQSLLKLAFTVPTTASATAAGGEVLLIPEELLRPLSVVLLTLVAGMLLQALDLVTSSEVQRDRWYQNQMNTLTVLSEQRLDQLGHDELVRALQFALKPAFDGSSMACLVLLGYQPAAAAEDRVVATGVHTFATLDGILPATLAKEDVAALTCVLASDAGHKPVVIPDLSDCSCSCQGKLSGLHERLHVNSLTVVPLLADGVVCGGLVALSPEPGAHDTKFQQFFQNLASMLSGAIMLSRAMHHKRATDKIIEDVMPRQVAERLKQRAMMGTVDDWSMGPDSAGSIQHHSPASRHCPTVPRSISDWSVESPDDGDGAEETIAAVNPRRTRGLRRNLSRSLLGSASHSTLGGGPLRDSTNGKDASMDDPARQSPDARLAGMDNSSHRLSTSDNLVYKQWHESVTVLFCDIVGYTNPLQSLPVLQSMSQELEPEQVMLLLHELFTKYDKLADKWGVYKVETIGDCYMACTGVTRPDPQHAETLLDFAVDMVQAANSVLKPISSEPVAVRVGLHSGRVMSGIVGMQRARYCLFGDTVNTASRMESTGVANHLQVSEATYELLPEELQEAFVERGQVEIKGKGSMRTFLLDPYMLDGTITAFL